MQGKGQCELPLELPDSRSIFANIGFKGNSAILIPRGSVRRQYLSSPVGRKAKTKNVNTHEEYDSALLSQITGHLAQYYLF